jgi:acyl-CoA synthetase (AMP-forming)/AMP-acid ligase II
MSTFRRGDARGTESFVTHAVAEWAQKTPDKVAVRTGDRSISYRALDERSAVVASGLLALGAKRGSTIGYLSKNGPEFFELWLAASKIGAVFAPLNFRSAVPELAAIVDDAEPLVVFVGEDMTTALRDAGTQSTSSFITIVIDQSYEEWVSGLEPLAAPVTLSDSDIALLSYTSGTTGLPKGVMWSHGAFARSFRWNELEPSMRWSQDDVALMVMPNFHLAGSWVSLPALNYGATIAILPTFEPTAVLQAIAEWEITLVCLVPTAIQFLLAHPKTEGADFGRLRSILYAGSPISAETLERALDVFGCELIQFYGTSETYMISILRPEQHDPSRPDVITSCGAPLPYVEVRLIGLDGADVDEVGEIGEVLVRSEVMFSAYRNNPEATAAAMIEGWYRTGDLGYRDAEANIYLVDRAKDMIVTGGENVYSVEVERALSSHPAIASVGVIGAPDTKWGERVTAYVVLKPGVDATEAELQEHCRALIAAYKVPKTVIIETDLPMTASGKIQKVALRERARQTIPA